MYSDEGSLAESWSGFFEREHACGDGVLGEN